MASMPVPHSGSFPYIKSPIPKKNEIGPLHGVHVPMKDGTRIALDVLFPEAPAGTTFTTILMMTRYGRNRIDQPLDNWQIYFVERGHVAIHGDVRGTGASFGQWPYHRSRAETLDFTEIMDWIVTQPWSDGRIIGTGTSYSANTADWMAERHHPALKSIVPRYSDYDPYADLYFPGGVPNAFMGKGWGLKVKELDLNIYRDGDGKLLPGVRTVDGPDGQRLLEDALKEHAVPPTVWEGIQEVTFRDDGPTSWSGVSMTEFGIVSHMEKVDEARLPCQNWAGWMDAGTADGAVRRFIALRDSPEVHVVIGPWSHGGGYVFDPLGLDNDEAVPNHELQMAEVLLYVEHRLAGTSDIAKRSLTYYTYGERKWKTTTVWPPANTRHETWYFGKDHTLITVPDEDGVDRYTVDFEVGSGKKTRWATNYGGGEVIYTDRSEIDKRLLCYTTPPIQKATEITGHPILTMSLTSTETDGTFIAYLELVAPDGKVLYLTEGHLRAIHRRILKGSCRTPAFVPDHSYLREDAMPLVPGELAEISFALQPISVLVPQGHCIRIAVAGTDADVFARVPAVGFPTLDVHYGSASQSRLVLPVIDCEEGIA